MTDQTPQNKSPKNPPARRAVTWVMQRKWRMTRALTLGAQVCVIDSIGRVLLIRHGYRPGWHFPGGGVEFGESVIDAAGRELEEEAGIVPAAPLELFGLYNNAANFRGDHIALFTLRAFRQPTVPAPSFEIAEQGFFPASQLPAGTTDGTVRRIAEITRGATQSPEW